MTPSELVERWKEEAISNLQNSWKADEPNKSRLYCVARVQERWINELAAALAEQERKDGDA